MVGKKIIWSDKAKNEFQSVLDFYIERNGTNTYSSKILNETENLLKTLSKSEFIGRLTTNRKTLKS